jgi:hypothetical protein
MAFLVACSFSTTLTEHCGKIHLFQVRLEESPRCFFQCWTTESSFTSPSISPPCRLTHPYALHPSQLSRHKTCNLTLALHPSLTSLHPPSLGNLPDHRIPMLQLQAGSTRISSLSRPSACLLLSHLRRTGTGYRASRSQHKEQAWVGNSTASQCTPDKLMIVSPSNSSYPDATRSNWMLFLSWLRRRELRFCILGSSPVHADYVSVHTQTRSVYILSLNLLHQLNSRPISVLGITFGKVIQYWTRHGRSHLLDIFLRYTLISLNRSSRV